MSFLAQIVERALGLVPLIQPVVASRFATRPHPDPMFSTHEAAGEAKAEPSDPSRGTNPQGAPGPPPAYSRSVHEVTGSTFQALPPQDESAPQPQPASREPQAEGVALGREFPPAHRSAQSPVETKPAAWSHSLEEEPPAASAPAPPGLQEAGRASSEGMLSRSSVRPGGLPAQAPRSAPGSAAAQPLRSPSRTEQRRGASDPVKVSDLRAQPNSGSRLNPLAPGDTSSSGLQAQAFKPRGEQPQASPSRNWRGRFAIDPVQPDTSSAPPQTRPQATPLVPVEARRPPLEPRLFESPTPPQAPAIRVTIGRIEVRAVHPPAPAPRKEEGPQAPGLSLDEYLKKFSGGLR